MLGNDFSVNLFRFVEVSLLFADPSQLVLEIATLGRLFDCPLERHTRTGEISDFQVNGAQLDMRVSGILPYGPRADKRLNGIVEITLPLMGESKVKPMFEFFWRKLCQ